MKKLLDNSVFKLFFGLFKGCFYALVVLYLIFLIAQSMSGKGIAGYRVYTIRTGSMEPEYKVNDVILVKDTKVEDLKTGDVITYVADDTGKMTITHRIISINDNPDGSATIVTKGDANEVEDQAFNSSKVQGKLALLDHYPSKIVFCNEEALDVTPEQKYIIPNIYKLYFNE